MLHLRLLGSPALEEDGSPLPGAARHRHSLALLALLARAPSGTLGRGTLVGLLWPEVPETSARNRLSTSLHRLREGVERDLVVSEGAALRLNHRRVRSDVYAFEEALEDQEWDLAVEHHRGPFLDGFWLPDSPAFDQWMDQERARLHRRLRDALESLARDAEARGDLRDGIHWWRRLRDEVPHDSSVAVELVERLARAGDRVAALRAAEEHTHRLASDYGMTPDPRLDHVVGPLRAPDARRPEPTPAPTSPQRHVVAVLPFERLGAEAADDAFADGLHHDLLTRLSRAKDLKVISRTSVLRSRAQQRSMPALARDLGAGTVVEGSIQKAGGRVRLNVQLVDATDDTHLWAEHYDRELTARGLFDIQEELVERIADSLQAELRSVTAPGQGYTRPMPTEDLQAYRLHAHGRFRLDERTESGMRAALAHFERAGGLDPGYAEAHVGVADALILLHEYGYEEAAPALERAEEAALRAIGLDPGLAGAHASIGLLHEARRAGPQAIEYLQRAVELQPSYADAHNWLSWTSQLLGRAEAALRSAERAVELNPLSAESVSNLSVSLVMNGRPEEGLQEARRGRELQPGWGTAIFYEALALFDLGYFGEAARLLEDLPVPWAGHGPEATGALIHAVEGHERLARRALESFAKRGNWAAVGLLHAAFGEPDQALDALGRVQRWSYWPTLTVHHYYPAVLGPLRRDPRFKSIVGAVREAWGMPSE